MTDLNDKLRAFEAWVGEGWMDGFCRSDLRKDDEGRYEDSATHSAWLTFKAGYERATPAPQAAPSDARQGLQIAEMARQYGWKPEGDEGAFEFVTRIAYEIGWDDARGSNPRDGKRAALAAPLTQAAPRGYVICINGEADYDRLVEVGNFLCDIVKDDDQHPLFSLFDDVMDAIKKWEDVHVDLDALSTESVIADRASTCTDISSMSCVSTGMTRDQAIDVVRGVFKKEVAAPVTQEVMADEFCEGQWWLQELDTMAARIDATPDQKRAVYGVVRNLLRQFNKLRAATLLNATTAPKQPE